MLNKNDLKGVLVKEFYLSNVMTSGNGFPIYDIMVPLKIGFVTSSQVAFYTEDKDKLSEFLVVKDKLSPQEMSGWILNNLNDFFHIHDIKNNYGELSSGESLAYNHMKSVESLKEMYKENNFGVANFIERDDIKGHKVYVFHQSNGVISGEFQKSKKSKGEVYESQEYIKRKFELGKIKPEFIFTGVIAQKIVDNFELSYGLKGDIVKEGAEYELLMVVKGYLQELNIVGANVTSSNNGGLFINVRLSNNDPNIGLSVDKDKYVIVVGSDKKEGLILSDALHEIGKAYLRMKSLSYIKKMKV